MGSPLGIRDILKVSKKALGSEDQPWWGSTGPLEEEEEKFRVTAWALPSEAVETPVGLGTGSAQNLSTIRVV